MRGKVQVRDEAALTGFIMPVKRTGLTKTCSRISQIPTVP